MKFHQGKYAPKNPQKYVGDPNNIIYRSSWEKKAMVFFDNNPGILKWGSEELIIPYISPVDNRVHRYFPDFAVLYKTRDEQVKRALIEVKPLAQCSPPKTKKKTKRMLAETSTYLVNQAKWDAARAWCSNNGFEFMVLTEKELAV